jgi:hypothetical protein
MTIANAFWEILVGFRFAQLCSISVAVLATSAYASCADAQELNGDANAQVTSPLSVAEARKFLACKTHMTFSGGHGTQVSPDYASSVENLRRL